MMLERCTTLGFTVAAPPSPVCLSKLCKRALWSVEWSDCSGVGGAHGQVGALRLRSSQRWPCGNATSSRMIRPWSSRRTPRTSSRPTMTSACSRTIFSSGLESHAPSPQRLWRAPRRHRVPHRTCLLIRRPLGWRGEPVHEHPRLGGVLDALGTLVSRSRRDGAHLRPGACQGLAPGGARHRQGLCELGLDLLCRPCCVLGAAEIALRFDLCACASQCWCHGLGRLGGLPVWVPTRCLRIVAAAPCMEPRPGSRRGCARGLLAEHIGEGSPRLEVVRLAVAVARRDLHRGPA